MRTTKRMGCSKSDVLPVLILAGGEGKRMNTDLPKCLLELSHKNKSIIENIISLFNSDRLGNLEIYVAVSYKADLVRNYLGRIMKNIIFIDSAKGDVSNAFRSFVRYRKANSKQEFPDATIVTVADIYIELDTESLLNKHFESGKDMTVCAKPSKEYKDRHIILSGKSVRGPPFFKDIEERDQEWVWLKPGEYSALPRRSLAQLRKFVDTGVYVMNAKALHHMAESATAYQAMKSMYKKNMINLYVNEGLWLEINDKKQYDEANRILKKTYSEI